MFTGIIESVGVIKAINYDRSNINFSISSSLSNELKIDQSVSHNGVCLTVRSRPYLFSNSLAPTIVGATLKVFEMISKDTTLRDKLEENTNYFRKEMEKAGFDLVGADAAIVPVMLYDAKLSQDMANLLLDEGIYVIGFFYPVVPKDKARIRVQLSAAHTKEHLNKAIKAFIKVGKKLNVI